jgi:hypothetical protein
MGADLLLNLATGHYLHNGNKRISIVFTAIFLYKFNLVFKEYEDPTGIKMSYSEYAADFLLNVISSYEKLDKTSNNFKNEVAELLKYISN